MAEGIYTKRTVRLWGIVGYLSLRGTVTTGEQIAERFDISKRSVYRDIVDLRAMGLDVAGEAGTGFFVATHVVEMWIDGMLYRNPRAKVMTSKPNYCERIAAAAQAVSP